MAGPSAVLPFLAALVIAAPAAAEQAGETCTTFRTFGDPA